MMDRCSVQNTPPPIKAIAGRHLRIAFAGARKAADGLRGLSTTLAVVALSPELQSKSAMLDPMAIGTKTLHVLKSRNVSGGHFLNQRRLVVNLNASGANVTEYLQRI